MSSLNRRFTPMMLLMISINGMVGSAWLFAPMYAAKIAGSSAIIAWLIGGFATAVIALTFAELSTLFPVAGGTAQIPQMSHGMLASFMLTWAAWLSAMTMAPIEVQAILQYASTYFTSLMTPENNTHVLTHVGYVWATLLMALFCVINIASFQGLVRFNYLLFVFKIAVIILAIFAIIHTTFYTENFIGTITNLTTINGWHAVLTAVATGGVAFAFTGFKHGVELAGETRQLALAIPLAIVGSVIACLILYLGLQVAFLGAIPPTDIAHGWENLAFVGDVGPFAGLAAGIGLTWLVTLLYMDAVVSPAGAGLIYVTSTARILYAMGEIGYLPKWLTYLNNQKFPTAAIIVNFVLGMFLFLPLPGWQAMVSFLVSGMVISYAIGPIALLCMRYEIPEQKRLFRVPAAPFFCAAAFYFCNLLSYWTGWDTIYKLAIAMGIGLLFFVVAVLRGSILRDKIGIKSALWLVPYFVGLFTISYYGSFGGKNVIPFGWDFLVIGVFSLVILVLAVKNRAAFAGETNYDERLAAIHTV